MNAFDQLVSQLTAPSQVYAGKVKRKTELRSTEKPAKAARTDTKKSRAVDIYKANIAAGKSAVITLFKTELAMTDAGANSYFYATKKLCK